MTRTDIINHLIKKYGYKSYLEIGVQNRTNNFNHINCRTKTGVDPDPKSGATFIGTSDSFFKQNKATYDIIFIDGLHHAKQVQKDIQNALYCLNENGAIVCHDMLPTTEEMQAVPRMTKIWTGDCWKAFAKLRSHSDLEMFTIDTDFGIGIIRRGSQIPFNAEDLTWRYFEKHKSEMMNIISVQDLAL